MFLIESVMSAEYHGGCMCGAIKFTWSGAPRFVKDCICESCRRAHGAAAVTWMGGPSTQFTFDRGETSLKWYRSSEESERGFCVECGTRLLFRSIRWEDEIHVALACVEDHDLASTGISFENELPSWTFMRPKVG